MDILSTIRRMISKRGKVLNIVIAGCTCSGKTTLVKKVENELLREYSLSLIQQDYYFKDIEKIPKSRKGFLMDSINAFETHEFQQDITSLLKCGATFIPRYDVSRNKRITKDVYVSKSQINIFEGLHVIELLHELENSFTIFLNTPIEVCLERRIARDVSAYNISEQRIREYFYDCVLPMYKAYVLPQKEKADVILDEGRTLI